MFIKKPWGSEEVIEINERYMVKKLTMLKDHRCSLQFHHKKHETIFILSGRLRIYVGESQIELSSKVYGPNESITLGPGILHRMEAVEDCVYLEASTPELDDVVRISDDYNRVSIL
jgi:mannose-6-phosphate isomerase